MLEDIKESVINVDEVNINEEESINQVELPKFNIPRENPNCKKCHGTGRLGYTYDPKNKELDENGNVKKGKIIPCPNYQKLVQKELKKYIDGLTDEQKYQLSRKQTDPKTLEEAKEVIEKEESENIGE